MVPWSKTRRMFRVDAACVPGEASLFTTEGTAEGKGFGGQMRQGDPTGERHMPCICRWDE